MQTTTSIISFTDSFAGHFADAAMFTAILIAIAAFIYMLATGKFDKKLAQGFMKAREVSSEVTRTKFYQAPDHTVHYLATDRHRPYLVVTKHAEFLCDFDRLARFYAGERLFL